MVEYRVYVGAGSGFYWFVFRAGPDAFDAMKDDFDAIIDSLELG